MDEWIREHLKKCIRTERASKILTLIDERLYFQVHEPDRLGIDAINKYLKKEGYVEYPLWENTNGENKNDKYDS